MNKYTEAEQEKELIMNELFIDIDNKKCILDTYLDNGKSVKSKYQELSDISNQFLKQVIAKLKSEYSNGRALFFRKYNYEKILNTYLENKYNVNEIELSMFSSKENEKNKQKPQEKQFAEQKNKIVNVLEKERMEKHSARNLQKQKK